MSNTFFPKAPGAYSSAESPPRMMFPSAVSAPATSSDWAATEQLRQKAADRARPNNSGYYKGEGNSSPSLDRSASLLEEGRAGASPSKHTFSIEQPSAAEEPQDIPLIHVRWGEDGAEVSASPSQARDLGAVEPGTPPRDHRSPAKNYPTPEPSANPYQEEPVVGRKWRGSWGGGLLSAPSKRSRCPKPSTVFITILVLLAVLLIGLTVGHFVAPYVRTMTYLHAPAPAPGLEAVPAAAGMDRSGGQDGSSIEGVGIGLQTDYPSMIPADGTSVTPTRNPFLDGVKRQGSGSTTLTPDGQGP